jgi:hypothetical protein
MNEFERGLMLGLSMMYRKTIAGAVMVGETLRVTDAAQMMPSHLPFITENVSFTALDVTDAATMQLT